MMFVVYELCNDLQEFFEFSKELFYQSPVSTEVSCSPRYYVLSR
jgi:hypothetical protein